MPQNRKQERKLVDRALELLDAPPFAGLGLFDRAIVLALAEGMATDHAGAREEDLHGARVAGRQLARRRPSGSPLVRLVVR